VATWTQHPINFLIDLLQRCQNARTRSIRPVSKVVIVTHTHSVRTSERAQVERSAKPGFRPDIEGLRAVAVLAVVLFHADVPGVGGGFIGVDVFFVISGFLITGLLWREASTSGTVRLRGFYGARARRLLPAAALVGVVTAIASAVLLSAMQARAAFGDGIASALYVGNYWFIVHGVDYLAPAMPPSPFQHYWSLGVEEQFYLVWPAMIIGTAWMVRRVRRRSPSAAIASARPYLVVLGLIAAVSFVLSVAITYVVPTVAFLSLPTRAWQLAVGGFVALTAGQWRRLPAIPAVIAGWGGVSMLLLACTLFSTNTPYPGIAALVPVLGTVLLIGAGCASPARGCGRVLAIPPMQAVGRVSYSWYLWHWPVLLLAPCLINHPLGLAERLIAALCSLGLAVLTLKLIENPLRFAGPIRRSPGRSLALGGAATAIAVSVCVALLITAPSPVGHGAPVATLTITASTPTSTGRGIDESNMEVQQALAQVQAAISAATKLQAVPSNLSPPLTDAAAEFNAMFLDGCLRGVAQAGQPDCATGDPGSATTVTLVGDSHAAMWTPAFEQVAKQRRWRLETWTKASCPLLDLPIVNPLRRMVSRCDQWRDQTIARLGAEHPRLIVVSAWRGYVAGHGGYDPGFTSYDRSWNDSLTRLVQKLRGIGSEVLVLGPVPDPRTAVPICLDSHLADAMACAPMTAIAVNQVGIATEAAATQAGGAQYVDVTKLFCTTEQCPVIVGNTMVYFDNNHMTPEYSKILAPIIGALTERAFAGD
jgi:peptidoglycan/LPS O-acetylase OafA/YrhL/uncharacterized membrane protein